MTDTLVLAGADAFVDGAVVSDVTITVAGGRVAAVHTDRPTSVPDAAVVVDAHGSFVLAGMTLCHFHCDYRNPTWPQPFTADNRPGVVIAGAIAAARALLASGFTGYVGSGCNNNDDVQLEAAIEAGYVEGPRVRPCGTQMRFPGEADDVETISRSQLANGARVLKTFLTAGHGVYGTRELSDDDLATFVRVAHENGAIARAHCVDRAEVVRAVHAGIDLVDHGDEVDDECIELMATHGTYWAPSALFHWVILQDHGRVIDPEWVASAKETIERFATVLPSAHAAGVNIVLGDDYGISLLPHEPGVHGRELELYAVELGCGVGPVLEWATRNGAALFDAPGRSGRLRSGDVADLVLVDGNPFDDPRIMQDASRLRVMKDGIFTNEVARA